MHIYLEGRQLNIVARHTMEKDLSLYYFPGSYHSQRARLCLEEKGLVYKPIVVNITAGETNKPEFMRINPKGLIPVLKHGEKIIADSVKIAEYLDETFTNKPMIPDTYSEDGILLTELVDLCRSIHMTNLTYGQILYPEIKKDSQLPYVVVNYMKYKLRPETVKAKNKMFQDLAEKHPDLCEAYLDKIVEYKERFVDSVDKESVMGQIQICQNIFEKVEEQLKKNALAGNAHYWIASPNITMADIEVGILMRRLQFLGLAWITWQNGKVPHVEKYYQRLSAKKTFNKICVKVPSKTEIIKQMVAGIPTCVKVIVIGVTAAALGYFIFTQL